MLRREILAASAAGAAIGIMSALKMVSKREEKQCEYLYTLVPGEPLVCYTSICPSIKTGVTGGVYTASTCIAHEYLDVRLPNKEAEKYKTTILRCIEVGHKKALDEQCSCGGVHITGGVPINGFGLDDQQLIDSAMFEKTVKVPCWFSYPLI